MGTVVPPIPIQTPTPTPGVGPGELLDVWSALVRTGWFLVGFVVVVLLGWYVVEPAISRTVRRRNRNNPTIQDAFSQYVRLLVVVMGAFVGATVAGYGRFLTNSALVVAAVTLAIGVAAQRVIGSLVSGVVLVMDPEFNVGDYIEWDEGEGTVQSITLRVTRVETPDGERVTVPNTVLTSQALRSPFRHGQYRIVDEVTLDYEDDLEDAMAHLDAAARAVDGILVDPEPAVYVDELGSDAVVVRVTYWIADPSRQAVFDVRSRFARTVKRRLEAADIAVSPTSRVEVRGHLDVDPCEDGEEP
jgi:small-conductance mechanosensitive channel